MEDQLVSVVIPTHNRAELVQDSIESILNQTYTKLELLIVDDHSTDNTEDVIKKISDERVVYVRNPGRRGAAATRNAGIAQARGEYVGFLDSDDQWRPTKLEQQVPLLAEDGRLSAVGCGWQWMDLRTRQVRIQRIPDVNGRIDGLPRWCFNISPDILIRRTRLDEVLFNEELVTYEGIDWVIRLFRGGNTLAFVPEVLVDCFDHQNSRASDKGLARVRALAGIIEEHEEFLRGDSQGWWALNRKAGAGLLMAGGDRKEARSFLIRSLRSRPADIRTWTHALASISPLGRDALNYLSSLRQSSNDN